MFSLKIINPVISKKTNYTTIFKKNIVLSACMHAIKRKKELVSKQILSCLLKKMVYFVELSCRGNCMVSFELDDDDDVR